MKLFISGDWMNTSRMPDKLVTQGYITVSPSFSIFFLVCSVSISIDGEYFCLEKLKGVWLGQSSVIIKLIFCWKSLFLGGLSLFSEDASLPPSKTRPKLTDDKTFSPEFKCLTLLFLSWSGVSHISRGRWGAQTVFPGEVKYTHMACGLMLSLKPQDWQMCSHQVMTLYRCARCHLASLLATSKDASPTWPFLVLHGALNEAVEK